MIKVTKVTLGYKINVTEKKHFPVFFYIKKALIIIIIFRLQKLHTLVYPLKKLDTQP